MTHLREYLLSPIFYGVWMGAVVASLHAARAVYETYGPWAAAALYLIAILAAFLMVRASVRQDDAKRNAERATELRAVIAYALKVEDTHVLRVHASGGQVALAEIWPGWPHFLAEFRKAEREA